MNQETFEVIDVDQNRYEDLRTTDISNDPPVQNLTTNWQQFYLPLKHEYDLFLQENRNHK